MLEPVDMGLPSGLLWSSVDLDFTKPGNVAETPFTYLKSFFSWGNVDGHNPYPDRNRFAYNWGSINSQAPFYQGQPYGSTPGSSLVVDIPLSLDCAQALLGIPWRMPSRADFKELFDNSDFVLSDGTTVIDAGVSDKRVTVNGVVGVYIKSRINGNLLFFSCSGYGQFGSWWGLTNNGYYWSSSYRSDRSSWCISFNNSRFSSETWYDRYSGCPVRPVYDPSLL